MKSGRPLEIAIVGLACKFPGGPDAATFWQNVLAGRDCTGDVPPDRWDPEVFFDPRSRDVDRVYCRRGGYLDAPIEFDPAAHGVMPTTVEGGEPEQFLVLDAARAALADAGLTDGVRDGRRVEVVIGRGNYFNRGNLTRLQHGRILAQTLALLAQLHPEWTAEDFEAVRADLRSSLPPFGPSTIPGQLTNATAGRIANRLNLTGASYVVDAASASSLVALDLGARALRDRRADLALVGGVYLAVDVDFPMVFCQLGALSRSGSARPFSKDADGTLPGEGVGVVILKRLPDAERDGDRVYAVLQGLGLASDGRRTGLAAPSARGHARAIRRAYRRAGIDPATVELVEGHGLGVPASDRAELRALRAVFPPRGKELRTLGAVSSLIGHAMPAAGMAGLIKTALALHNRVLPPSPSTDRPHALLGDAQSPFTLLPASRPWIHGQTEHPRRAGVNAFGFAGISAHAVLEEHRASADHPRGGPHPHWETEAILLGAPDRAAWVERARSIHDWLTRNADRPIAPKDLAWTLNTPSEPAPFRIGLVVQSAADLRDRLGPLIARIADPGCRSIRDARGSYFWEQSLAGPGALAFLFPGEGSQYPGMLADLCPHFPEVRTLFDTADRIACEHGADRRPSEVLFGSSAEADGLWAVDTAVTVVLSAQWALYRLLSNLGLAPDSVVGHSSGEFLALAAAGALSIDRRLEDQLGELGRVFEGLERSGRIPSAALMAVAADRDRIERLRGELALDISIAMDNCPHQVVVAGDPAAVDTLAQRLRTQGVLCELLPFARAYHTPAFAQALGPIRDFFATLPLAVPQARLYSCAIAGPMARDVEQVRRLAVEQWVMPVAFRSTVEAMHDEGVRIFVEVGTRGNLSGFVDDSLRDRPHFAVAANLPRRSGLTQLNHLVASLYAQGVSFRPEYLLHRRSPVRIDLDRDLPARRTVGSLAVGFPEMKLSETLARSLQRRHEDADSLAEPPGVDLDDPVVNEPVRNGRADHGVRERHVPIALETVAAPRSHEAFATTRNDVAHSPSVREQAVLAHMRTMDTFLAAQRHVMEAYRTTRGSQVRVAPAPAASPRPDVEPPARPLRVGPWVGTVRRFEAGRRLESVRRLEIRGDPVAEHHTLGGRKVSALDPTRRGLPVVPFTVMAEMLAQAAAALMPGMAVVGLRDVRAHRWIRYEEEPVVLELMAERDPGQPDVVRVEIYNRGTHAAPRPAHEGPVVAGQIVFDAERRPAAPAGPFTLAETRACRFSAEEIYAEQWLFHGPALRAVVEVGRTSPHGIEGKLRVLPRSGLLRDDEAGELLTDAIVLDAFTHLLGCWGLDQFADGEGDVIFPLRLGELTILGDDPPEGSEVECRIAIREVTRQRILADVDFVGPGGLLWMRLVGWEDWRFYWPGRFRDHFRQPDRTMIGEPIAVPGGADGLCAIWLEPPSDMGKPVWRDVLEWVQFAPEERRSLRLQSLPNPPLALRLWERIAAKDAVRRLLLEQGDPPVFPADLAVAFGSGGRPRIRSLIEPRREHLPAVAYASAEGAAAAIAAHDPDARLGIAIERLGESRTSDDRADLTSPDRAHLDSVARTPSERAEWSARFRAAREAASRAIGAVGTEIVAVDPRTGLITLELAATEGSGTLKANSARRGDYVWCWVGA